MNCRIRSWMYGLTATLLTMMAVNVSARAAEWKAHEVRQLGEPAGVDRVPAKLQIVTERLIMVKPGVPSRSPRILLAADGINGIRVVMTYVVRKGYIDTEEGFSRSSTLISIHALVNQPCLPSEGRL